MLRDEGRFKMNPPVRSEADRQALLAGIRDGTIDMIATDHAPHAPEEKSGGLRGSLMGVSGLEAAFPALYTGLVLTGEISLEKLIELMSVNPRKRFRSARRAGARGRRGLLRGGAGRKITPWTARASCPWERRRPSTAWRYREK
jgi:dihydroorotase-like cyclic amidohydrolase